MEVLNGTIIFWFIAIGMVAGALTKLVLWTNGVRIITNIIAGVLGAIVVGSISVILEFPGSLILSVMGSISVLFILNVFHLQPEASH